GRALEEEGSRSRPSGTSRPPAHEQLSRRRNAPPAERDVINEQRHLQLADPSIADPHARDPDIAPGVERAASELQVARQPDLTAREAPGPWGTQPSRRAARAAASIKLTLR